MLSLALYSRLIRRIAVRVKSLFSVGNLSFKSGDSLSQQADDETLADYAEFFRVPRHANTLHEEDRKCLSTNQRTLTEQVPGKFAK